VSQRFVRRLVAERRIAFVKVGRFVRIDPNVLDQYLADHTIDPPH
jgi:excisionase family DNA binding protein